MAFNIPSFHFYQLQSTKDNEKEGQRGRKRLQTNKTTRWMSWVWPGVEGHAGSTGTDTKKTQSAWRDQQFWQPMSSSPHVLFLKRTFPISVFAIFSLLCAVGGCELLLCTPSPLGPSFRCSSWLFLLDIGLLLIHPCCFEETDLNCCSRVFKLSRWNSNLLPKSKDLWRLSQTEGFAVFPWLLGSVMLMGFGSDATSCHGN